MSLEWASSRSYVQVSLATCAQPRQLQLRSNSDCAGDPARITANWQLFQGARNFKTPKLKLDADSQTSPHALHAEWGRLKAHPRVQLETFRADGRTDFSSVGAFVGTPVHAVPDGPSRLVSGNAGLVRK